MVEVREMLKLIHEEWGFFGAINLESIYYDIYTKKITLVDWYRNNLPFKHYPRDHRYGVVWPYNRIMKTCDDKIYRCFDKLAVFCCFAHFLEIKCQNEKSAEQKPLADRLSWIAAKLTKTSDLTRLGSIVDDLLNQMLQRDLTVEMVDEYIKSVFKSPK
jgi:hypothetical protein